MGAWDTAGTQRGRISAGVGPVSPYSRAQGGNGPMAPATGRRGPPGALGGVLCFVCRPEFRVTKESAGGFG